MVFARDAGAPAVIVVMGVASSGKTSLGERLAERLGWPFRDADSFHPPENVAKMAGGTPLNDADRAPWLAAIAAWIDAERAAGGHAIIACSALKRAYRDVLREPNVIFVHLEGSRQQLSARMRARLDHFMPASLLDSQLATLEPLEDDELHLTLNIGATPAVLAQQIIDKLNLTPS